jgi:ABC-type sugar transport system ATPase subunit
MTSSRLTGRGITKKFGSQTALDRVDFDLAAGEVKGLLGANGAGKSTLLKILAGAIMPDGGELLLNGKPISMSSMRDANSRGIALVSQELSLFPALSVRENLEIVVINGRRRTHAERDNTARSVLSELGLDVPLSQRLGRLSLGDRQLVEIARALLQEPQVLILDEPSSALHEAEKRRLLQVIKDVRARGVGVIYVSHFLEEVLEVADALVVLRDGKRVPADFKPSKERLPELVSAMLGEKILPDGSLEPGRRDAPRAVQTSTKARSLIISGVRGPAQLSIASWTVESGKVIGVAGLIGAGVEELFGILFGRVRAVKGVIELPSGRPAPHSVNQAVQSGVAYVPADRKRVGLALEQTIADNVSAVRSLVQRADGFFLSQSRSDSRARDRCTALRLRNHSVRQKVGSLSGGNQQKVVFAKWLEAKPSLVLLDDPTRGVDIGAKREMHGIIRSLADEGCVVLMHSSDPLELVNVCARVHVFVNGALQSQLEGDRLTEHALVSAMNRRSHREEHSSIKAEAV